MFISSRQNFKYYNMKTITNDNFAESTNDLCFYIKDFIRALLNVESRYILYQLRGHNDDEQGLEMQKQYERVFAYEFYHQYRKLMELNPEKYEGIYLNGEAHKGDSIYSKVPQSMPDIILNKDPGKIVDDGQFFLCEMKTAANKEFYKDFEKLYTFKESGLKFKEYIFLSIGETIDGLHEKITKNMAKIMHCKYDNTLCLCINLDGNQVEIARLRELLNL